MSDKRCSVVKWNKAALQAAQMSVGRCKHGDTIGIDLIARDGRVFAHGHLDLNGARELHRCLGNEIATMEYDA